MGNDSRMLRRGVMVGVHGERVQGKEEREHGEIIGSLEKEREHGVAAEEKTRPLVCRPRYLERQEDPSLSRRCINR